MHTTSLTLMARLQGGGSEADWQRLVQLYTPFLYFLAHRYGLEDSDAADLVQEVLRKLVVELPKFKYNPAKGTFRSWLRKITTRLIIDFRRKQHKLREVDVAVLDELHDASQIETIWEAEHNKQLVAQAIKIMRDSFEENTWKAFWEMKVNGRSAKEVGCELGMSEGAVYLAVHRVLNKLKAELVEFMD